MKIDIGCMNQDFKKEGHYGIDNAEMDETDTHPDMYADGRTLPFKDASVDEVFSSRCIGFYCEVDDAIRVLKKGGKMTLLVWNWEGVLGKLVHKLVSSGFTITHLEGTNVDYDTEPKDWDVLIEATKD